MTDHVNIFAQADNDLESVSHDISEARIRESEQRFRTTFENAAVGIAHVDPNGRWLLVNKRYCEIVGYTAEELAGKTFHDITHPDDIAADLAQRQRVLSGAINPLVWWASLLTSQSGSRLKSRCLMPFGR